MTAKAANLYEFCKSHVDKITASTAGGFSKFRGKSRLIQTCTEWLILAKTVVSKLFLRKLH